MPSVIRIKFNDIPLNNSFVSLKVGYSDNSLKESFSPVRTAKYQSTKGANAASARNEYLLAFTADYNLSELFTVTSVGADEIDIENPNSGFFTLGEFSTDTAGDVTFVSVTDTADIVTISITDVSFSAATDVCGDAQLDITTDILAAKYRINGGADVVNAANPFNFEQLRGAYINLEVENTDGNTTNQNIQVPQALSVSNATVSVTNSPSGATITTVLTDVDGLTLTYSLDDITYQTSNSFSAITAGSYTSYIKDDLGCKIQLDFTVEAYEDGGVGVQYPIANLPSKSNSIRYANRVTHGNCSNYKNDENTLSCELAHTLNPREVYQLFQDCDTITTQIKSNYQTIVATVVQEDLTETVIPINQKTTNIGLKNKRDATKYNLGNNQTGIYFTSGTTYDFDTDIADGTYALNGALPIWGFIGNYIVISGVWFQIVDILFDEDKNAEVLVINDNYTGVAVSVVAGSIYNLQDYEVSEFDIDMSVFPDQKIQVNITQTDTRTGFDDVIFLSEILEIKERHEKTVEIKYYSDINTDMFFSTGIINSIRVPIEFIEGGFEDDTEAEKTDTSVYLVNSEVYETDTFHFDLQSKQLIRKNILALSHKFVTIDEVSYSKESSPSVTPLIGTNLYRMSAEMTKADNIYTSQGAGTELEVGTLEVPGLIEQTSEGFIKWD